MSDTFGDGFYNLICCVENNSNPQSPEDTCTACKCEQDVCCWNEFCLNWFDFLVCPCCVNDCGDCGECCVTFLANSSALCSCDVSNCENCCNDFAEDFETWITCNYNSSNEDPDSKIYRELDGSWS
tara:strand:- start:782 stop:1159 length:378 start_codon:yes stop_codon:yes gene_type:complete